MLCDKDDNANVIHYYSSRAVRTSHSTEQAELLALYLPLQSLENVSKMTFKLLKKQIPLFFYIYFDAL